ncbi:MAG: hypothetical protein JW958_00830, partial [Candidatus Eisenbacteria bacterium]|nr:hypothetical protein [Candidatus Eisenbacteria bacterium]
ESSSAAQELAGQSQELAAMVGRFQLNRRANAAVSSPAETVKKASPRPKRASRKMTSEQKAAAGIPLTEEELIPLQGDPDFADF